MVAGWLANAEVLLLSGTPGGDPGGALGSLPCLALAASHEEVQTYPLTTEIMTQTPLRAER